MPDGGAVTGPLLADALIASSAFEAGAGFLGTGGLFAAEAGIGAGLGAFAGEALFDGAVGGAFDMGGWSGTGLDSWYSALPNTEGVMGLSAGELAETAGTTGIIDPWTKQRMLAAGLPAAAGAEALAAGGAGGSSPGTFDPMQAMQAAGNPAWTGAQGGFNWAGGPGLETAVTGVNPMNAIAEWAGNVGQMGPIGQAQTAYSAYKGLSLADQMRKMAAMSGQRIDPWGTGGGREAAAGQLQGVVNGGSDAYMNTPAYKARIQAVQRAMAPYGNSGNLAAAGAAAGGAGYNDYVQQMAQLAGVGNGGAAGQLQLSGMGGAADLTSKALATGAYGLTRSQPNQVPNASSSWFS